MSAQPGNFYVETYTTRDGLSHNEVSCIFKDSRNLLWVGTEFGLNMFDGNEFTSFFHIPGDSNSLLHNKILSIDEDQQHNLWIGTQSGVSCFNLLTRKFINYSRQNTGANRLDIEFSIAHVGKDGTVWIGHSNGITQLNPVTGKTRLFNLPLSPPQQFRNRYISDFLEDEAGDLWAATSLGVYRLKKNGSAFQSFRFADNVPGEIALNACTHLAIDNQGTVYCGTWNAGIIYFNQSTQKFEQLEAGNLFKTTSVFDICFAGNRIWVATIGDLYFSVSNDLKKEKKINWQKYESEKMRGSLAAFFILEDNHSFWFSTQKGLVRFKATTEGISNYSFSSVNNWSPLSIVEAGEDRLAICNGLALISYDLKQRKAVKILDTRYPVQLIPTSDGYWLTAAPGLYKLDNQMRVREVITHADTTRDPEIFGSLYEDDEGLLWISVGRKGLRQYDKKTKKWRSFFENTGIGFRQITADQYGNIWLAHSLLRYDKMKKNFQRIQIKNAYFDSTEVNSVTSIFPAGNIVWISTYGGLYCYDYTRDSVFNVPLPSNISPRIGGLVADRSGHIWLESKGKLVMYDINQKTFKIFSEADGFAADDMSPKFAVLKNGNVVVGYNGGFTVLDPSKITVTGDPLTPEFTGITINDHPVADTGAKISLKYNESINFSFVSPSYDASGKNQYAYQLQPLDKEWKSIGNNITQRFTNLPPGKYTFKLKAGSASGRWNANPVAFIFLVTPPFWKTWWFIMLAGLVIVSFVYVIYRYRIRQILKMEKLRTRIASDLHDDIGATLSSISMYSDAVKEQLKEKLPHLQPVLEKMGENSRSMVGSMSDIVWAINPDNDEGEKLVERMEGYARDICVVKNVNLRFKADEKIQKLKLSLDQRKNLYLVFKEAVNNALKYAECSTLSVGLTAMNKMIVLTITDDGKGFDLGGGMKGNGLKNMGLRVAEINSKLKIDSIEGKGTEIRVESPIA